MNTEQIKKLHEYFENQGITQKQISGELNLSKMYVNMLFMGRRYFGRKTAQRFQDLYGISAAWLMTGEGEMMVSDRYSDAIPPQLSVNHKVIYSLRKQIEEQNALIEELKNVIHCKDAIIYCKNAIIENLRK